MPVVLKHIYICFIDVQHEKKVSKDSSFKKVPHDYLELGSTNIIVVQEVLLAVADKLRKPPKRPCLNVQHGRSPAPQLVALMKDCWHAVLPLI